MRKLLSTIIALYFVLHGIEVFGQVRTTSSAVNPVTINDVRDLMKKSSNPNFINKDGRLINLSKIEGSPYWHKDFEKGAIIIKDRNEALKTYIRYQIFNDFFEIKTDLGSPKSEILELNRSSNIDIIIENKKFVFLENLPIKVRNAYGTYAMILQRPQDSTGATLYKSMTLTFIPPKESETSYDMGQPAHFEKNNYYFVKIEDKLYHIEPHKRKAPKDFPDHKKELKDFIKEKNLNFRGNDEQADMVYLVRYYNTLD